MSSSPFIHFQTSHFPSPPSLAPPSSLLLYLSSAPDSLPFLPSSPPPHSYDTILRSHVGAITFSVGRGPANEVRGHSALRYSTVQYSTLQYSAVQDSTIQYSTVQYSTVQYSTLQYSTVQYSTFYLYLTLNVHFTHPLSLVLTSSHLTIFLRNSPHWAKIALYGCGMCSQECKNTNLARHLMSRCALLIIQLR